MPLWRKTEEKIIGFTYAENYCKREERRKPELLPQARMPDESPAFSFFSCMRRWRSLSISNERFSSSSASCKGIVSVLLDSVDVPYKRCC